MATGDRHYYEIARNLLRSYRWYSREPLPFAIICEEENEFTAEFDKTVIIYNPIHSFLDKIRLPELVPYDETIFIDSDCLAYRDLNGLWELFAKSGDFSYLGFSFPFSCKYGWFQREDVGVFADKVQFSVVLQGGIYFMRKGKLDSFSKTCHYIFDNFSSFKFSGYPYVDPVDEPILALASAVHGFTPARSYERVYCYYPLCGSSSQDISKGRLRYRYNSTVLFPEGRFFMHWSTVETRGDVYKKEVRRLDKLIVEGRKPRALWEVKNRILDFILICAYKFWSRINR